MAGDRMLDRKITVRAGPSRTLPRALGDSFESDLGDAFPRRMRASATVFGARRSPSLKVARHGVENGRSALTGPTRGPAVLVSRSPGVDEFSSTACSR